MKWSAIGVVMFPPWDFEAKSFANILSIKVLDLYVMRLGCNIKGLYE